MTSDAISLWIERVRRDPQVTNAAFRIAHSIAAHAGHDSVIRARMVLLAARAGVSTSATSIALDRLSGLGYVALRRGGSGQAIVIRLSQRQPKKADVALGSD